MERLDSLKTGASLAITIAIGYFVCAMLFLASPGLAASFLDALFHGLQFSRLQAGDQGTFASAGSARKL